MPIINNEENKEMKLILERFNNDIKEIIGILNKTMDKIKLYSKIYSDYIDDFDENFINYQILNNFNELSIYNKKVINEMNQIINEIRIDKKINNIINLYNRFTENEANIIKYKINNLEKKVKLFGKDFVKNNANNCKIICDNKEYDLVEYFDINDY